MRRGILCVFTLFLQCLHATLQHSPQLIAIPGITQGSQHVLHSATISLPTQTSVVPGESGKRPSPIVCVTEPATVVYRRDDGVTVVGASSTLVVNDGGGGGGGSGGGLTTDQKIAIGVGIPSGIAGIFGTIVAIMQYRKHNKKKTERRARELSAKRTNGEGYGLATARAGNSRPYMGTEYHMQPVEAPLDGYNGTQAELPGTPRRAELGP